MTIRVTPLDPWIEGKIHAGARMPERSFGKALEEYQIQKINEVIEYARGRSAFYRHHLAALPAAPLSLSDILRVPFTTASDIVNNPSSFLAVRQDEVARIVTLRTSGSTGEAKRLFFTEEDLELTIDFFHHGMSTLVRAGQKAVVFLPCARPDSVGDLLVRALKRMDVTSLAYGPVTDAAGAAFAIASFGAHCLVGIPTQLLAVARSDRGIAIGKGRVQSILLSTDYVPRPISDILGKTWGCRVFTHYGMTEMGLGGGVECEALNGYHLREADLYFEIVDPLTGQACPQGVTGEVVFTTLNRLGMPLIRYRTGDMACMIPEPCPCGSALRRMACVRGRWNEIIGLGPGNTLALSDMDESLFRLTGLLDYRATVSRGAEGRYRLHIDVYREEGERPTDHEVLRCLEGVEPIRKSVADGGLEKPTVSFSKDGRWNTTGVVKRKIVVDGTV